jgi:hypothetical protein
MVVDHWMCQVCEEMTLFPDEPSLRNHLLEEHGDTIISDEVEFVADMSARMKLALPDLCPVCDIPKDDPRLGNTAYLDHICDCIHGFSLRSLPWNDRDRVSYECNELTFLPGSWVKLLPTDNSPLAAEIHEWLSRMPSLASLKPCDEEMPRPSHLDNDDLVALESLRPFTPSNEGFRPDQAPAPLLMRHDDEVFVSDDDILPKSETYRLPDDEYFEERKDWQTETSCSMPNGVFEERLDLAIKAARDLHQYTYEAERMADASRAAKLLDALQTLDSVSASSRFRTNTLWQFAVRQLGQEDGILDIFETDWIDWVKHKDSSRVLDGFLQVINVAHSVDPRYVYPRN